MPRFKLLFWCFAVWVLVLIGLPTTPHAQEVADHEIKAVFIQSLVKYISWPDPDLGKEGSEITICTLGSDRVGASLEDTRSTFRGVASLTIEQHIPYSKLASCQLLYIGLSESQNMDAILSKARLYPVVTVSDAPEFARQGGMIEFTVGDRMELQVNLSQMKKSDISISGTLLQLAETVY